MAIGFAAYEPQPPNTASSVSGSVPEPGGGTNISPVSTAALSSGVTVAQPQDVAADVDPGLSQLAMIEDVASSVTGQRSGQAIASGAVLPSGFERIRLALGEAAGVPEDLFRLAVAMPVADPEATLAAYSLAALGGHNRAAYYLGQKYELGEGVPRNLNVARAWYDQGARTIAGAGNRSRILKDQITTGALIAPIPLYRQVTPDGELDMIWTIAPNATVGTFTVELADARVAHRGRTRGAGIGGQPRGRALLPQVSVLLGPLDPEPLDPEDLDPEPLDPEPLEPDPLDPEPLDREPLDPELVPESSRPVGSLSTYSA